MDRVEGYGEVSTELALLSDRRLGELVAAARPLGAGIGGSSALLPIAGAQVFVKRIPLTDLELSPHHIRSTANLFGLPPHSQYGVGGPSFGAWRELAANIMTTGWVLTGRCPNFALMYHWRVLPGTIPTPSEHVDIDRVVELWGSSAVRERLEALARSTNCLVLFLEYLPSNLQDWLTAKAADGGPELETACAMVERDLRDGVTFMNANGLLHFDAHPRNILTDGQRLYFADFGLATSPRFELGPAEAAFVADHADHDRRYASMELVKWLMTNLTSITGWPQRFAAVRRLAEEGTGPQMPPWALAMLKRHAAEVVWINDFYWNLHTRGPAATVADTPWPQTALPTAHDRHASLCRRRPICYGPPPMPTG